MAFNYSVDQPPTDWKQYPKSFLRAAIPKLNVSKSWSDAWNWLAATGLTDILKSGGCPVIEKFNPKKTGLTTATYSYQIKANPKLNYFIALSIFDKNGKFISTNPTSKLSGEGEIKSTKGEIGAIQLSVKPFGVDDVIDFKRIQFTEVQQPLLF